MPLIVVDIDGPGEEGVVRICKCQLLVVDGKSPARRSTSTVLADQRQGIGCTGRGVVGVHPTFHREVASGDQCASTWPCDACSTRATICGDDGVSRFPEQRIGRIHTTAGQLPTVTREHVTNVGEVLIEELHEERHLTKLVVLAEVLRIGDVLRTGRPITPTLWIGVENVTRNPLGDPHSIDVTVKRKGTVASTADA
ncbi:hypothetical protein D3C78_636910 [compost metagenome]